MHTLTRDLVFIDTFLKLFEIISESIFFLHYTLYRKPTLAGLKSKINVKKLLDGLNDVLREIMVTQTCTEMQVHDTYNVTIPRYLNTV